MNANLKENPRLTGPRFTASFKRKGTTAVTCELKVMRGVKFSGHNVEEKIDVYKSRFNFHYLDEFDMVYGMNRALSNCLCKLREHQPPRADVTIAEIAKDFLRTYGEGKRKQLQPQINVEVKKVKEEKPMQEKIMKVQEEAAKLDRAWCNILERINEENDKAYPDLVPGIAKRKTYRNVNKVASNKAGDGSNPVKRRYLLTQDFLKPVPLKTGCCVVIGTLGDMKRIKEVKDMFRNPEFIKRNPQNVFLPLFSTRLLNELSAYADRVYNHPLKDPNHPLFKRKSELYDIKKTEELLDSFFEKGNTYRFNHFPGQPHAVFMGKRKQDRKYHFVITVERKGSSAHGITEVLVSKRNLFFDANKLCNQSKHIQEV